MNGCEIAGCRAILRPFEYWSLTLDDDRRIAVCRPCMRKIRALQRTQRTAKTTRRETKV